MSSLASPASPCVAPSLGPQGSPAAKLAPILQFPASTPSVVLPLVCLATLLTGQRLAGVRNAIALAALHGLTKLVLALRRLLVWCRRLLRWLRIRIGVQPVSCDGDGNGCARRISDNPLYLGLVDAAVDVPRAPAPLSPFASPLPAGSIVESSGRSPAMCFRWSL
jgi:hypothetical protein